MGLFPPKCWLRCQWVDIRRLKWIWTRPLLPGHVQGNIHGDTNLLQDLCCCSLAKSCQTLCDPMDCSTPGFPVLHSLLEFAQIHVHWVRIHECFVKERWVNNLVTIWWGRFPWQELLLSLESLQPAEEAGGPWNWQGLLSWVLPSSATWRREKTPVEEARPPDAPGAEQGVAKKARNRDDVFAWVKGP